MKTLDRLTVTTSEVHLLAVARHYLLEVFVEGDYLVTRRHLEDIGELEYRAPISWELSA